MTCHNVDCNKKFHACSSCGLPFDWEYSYCSEDCWKKSTQKEQNLIDSFVLSLTKDQLSDFQQIVDLSDDYYFTIQEAIKKHHI